MRKGIFERAYLNWHYRKDILMKDISERAFPKGHFDEGHFEGRAFPKGERAKGMKGIVHKLEFLPKGLVYGGHMADKVMVRRTGVGKLLEKLPK